MISGIKKQSKSAPIPVVSTFSRPIYDKPINNDCTKRQMTPQEYSDMIEKYGPPLMKLSERKGNHYLAGKKGKK